MNRWDLNEVWLHSAEMSRESRFLADDGFINFPVGCWSLWFLWRLQSIINFCTVIIINNHYGKLAEDCNVSYKHGNYSLPFCVVSVYRHESSFYHVELTHIVFTI